MTFMVMFRYGQLSDYTPYEIIYYSPEKAGITDPLYFFITDSLNKLGCNFEFFVIIVGALTMGLAYPFFSRLCKGSLTALFVFYCYVFLILPMSAMRQGMCVSVSLLCFNLLLSKKKKLFYLVACLGSFFHISMLCVILIGLLYDRKWFNKTRIILGVLLCLTVFALITPDMTSYIPEFLQSKSLGEYKDSRIIQISLRALLVYPLLLIKPKYGSLGYSAKAICIIGFSLYCLLAFGSTMAGRLEYYYRIYLCLFVSYIIFSGEKVRNGRLFLGLVLILHMVLFYKNIYSFISQGEYNERKVSVLNFPYITIFDKDELKQYK